jgi:hypothetical protein
LGGVVDPSMAFMLLNVWNAAYIPFIGYLLYLIIESTEDPNVEREHPDAIKDKEGPWWRNPGRTCLRLFSFIKSSIAEWVLIITMDSKFHDISTFWSKSNRWTVVRIFIFTVQLVVAIVVIRFASATMSVVAGNTTPFPAGPDIDIVLPYITESAKTIAPWAAFLLLFAGIGMLIPAMTISWYSLLNPKPRVRPDPNTTRWKRIRNTFTLKAFKIFGDKTPPWLFEAFLIVLILASFSTCLVYFSEIVTYAASSTVVSQSALADYSGIMGANLIFGLFTLPMGWVCWTLWDAARKRIGGWRFWKGRRRLGNRDASEV